MATQGEQPPQSSSALPELLGLNHWTGLLDPLDPSLRGLILLCGDLIQVTYDSFNSDPHSKYTGSCRYSKSTLLQKVSNSSRCIWLIMPGLEEAKNKNGIMEQFDFFFLFHWKEIVW
jgi:hypothetical protein